MHILLVDDHPLFREALGMLLAQRLPTARWQAVGTLAEALAALEHELADLLLIDLALADAQGLEALRALHEAAPAARAVVVSGDDRPETIYAALDAGAAGFIHKASHGGEFAEALGVVLEGGVALPRSLIGRASSAHESSLGALERLGLSERQWSVLQRVLQGKPNKLICRELDLSPSTVKTHLAEVFRRLGVRSRAQAMVEVARRGFQVT